MGKTETPEIVRQSGEPTYHYRKRIHPGYKGKRRDKVRLRQEQQEQRRAEREWQRIIDHV